MFFSAIRSLAVATGIVLAGAGWVHAQADPSKPVHIMVTFAAGGTTDALARAVARQLSGLMRDAGLKGN